MRHRGGGGVGGRSEKGRGGNNAEGGTSGNSNVMESLLTMLLSDRFSAMAEESTKAQRSPEADALREQIRKDMEKKK